MLTKEQWLAFRRMCAVGHHLSPGAKPFASAFSVDQWKLLKRWPTSLWASSPFASLTIDHTLVRETAKSWQEWHTETLTESTRVANARSEWAYLVDGIIGPVTIHATEQPRCGCPDFRPDESVAEGSWHPDCRKRLTWALQGGGFGLPGMSADAVTRCFELAYKYIASEIEGVAYVRDQESGERVNTFSRPARLGGSTLARHTLPPSENQSCGFHGWGEYDNDRTWSSVAYLVAVIIHEEGHGKGANHVKQSSGGIMTPGINSGAVARVQQWLLNESSSVYNDGDWAELTRRGYRKRETPIDPPPTDPQPERIALQGRLKAVGVETGKDFGEFIVVKA